jgi:hypothetical protein
MPATALVDLKNQHVGDVSVNETLASATTTEGASVDMQLSDGPVFGVLQFGAVTGSSADADVKLQESHDESTWTDCTNGTFTQSYSESTGDFVLEVINARRTKRYVRAHVTTAGTVTSMPICVTILGWKKILGGSGFYTEA